MARYYTVKQASLILGFSTNSIYKFLDEGRLQGNRGNSNRGRFRIPHSSLEKFVGTRLPVNSITHALNNHSHHSMQTKKEFANSSIPPPTTSSLPNLHPLLPLNLIRALIVIGFILILIDLLINQNFSLFQQLIRLTLMTILIILAYQFSDSTSSLSNQLPPNH